MPQCLEVSAALQCHLVSVCVCVGVGAATKGALSFMVGGQEAAYERAKPLLECMGGKMFHCGASGSGQVGRSLMACTS